MDIKKINKMIINGKNVTGLFKYSRTAEYREDDLVIDLGLLYVCLKDACDKKPSENPEYFTPYPKKKINSAAEYFDNLESDDYISSKALTEILAARDFGFSENGVIEDEITYDPNKGITCSILDQVYNYDILDTIMKKQDLNNGMFKVSNNLPEIRNLLLHNSTISTYIVVRQYTYGNMRVQELIDPENKTLYIRWAEEPWDLVSEWYSVITKDVHDYISEISAFYTSKLRQYESAFRLYQNKFCFSEVPFVEENGVYKVKLENLGLESQPEDTFIINVIASKSISQDLKRNYTAFVDLSDTNDTYLTTDSNIHLEFDSEYLTITLSSCTLKNIYYREKTSLLETPPVVIVKPSVHTLYNQEVETTKAICRVILTSLGGDELEHTTFGICYSSQYGTPVLDNSDRLDISTYTVGVPVDVRIENLNPNTTYYFRAFANNTEGTSYGEVRSFTTKEEHTKPGVIIKSISPGINDIKVTYNVTGNNILSNGIWYSTDPSESPGNGGTIEYNTIKSSEKFNGEVKAGQDYTMILSNKIVANTKYYISAFATNSYNLTGYSNILPTTTGTTSELKVSMYKAWTNTSDSINCSGQIDDNGGYEITKTGFIWSLEDIKNPVSLVDDQEQYVPVPVNSDFTATITGLTPRTQYYIYAYAKNSNGAEKCSTYFRCSTNSAATSPTVIISNQGSSGPNNASAMITVTNTGGSDIEKVGLWYSLSSGTPSENDENIEWVNASQASIQVTRLTANTRYYLRGVAKNEDGYFGYSSEVIVQTQSPIILEPILSINQPISNAPELISLSGSVSIPEGYTGTIIERGFLYTTYGNEITGVEENNRIIESNYSSSLSNNIIYFSCNWKPGVGVLPGKYNFKSYIITTTGSYISDSTVTGTLYPTPDLITGTATSTIVGNDTASVTFTGLINNLSDVRDLVKGVGFKYGTSVNELNDEVVSGLGKVSSEFSATINLQTGNTYYFRAFIIINSSNISYWLASNTNSITIRAGERSVNSDISDIEENNT